MYNGHGCQILPEEGTYKSSGTAREGEEGQVPSELFGNAEGFYTNGLLCGWDRGTRGLERGEEACHSTGRQVNREYSQMVYYVRVRMAIVVVQANILLIRGSRDRQQPRRPLIPDRAALRDWQTWQDR